MNEYIVTFHSTRQISECEWEVFNPTLKITDKTTVKEIRDFYKKYNLVQKVEVKLIELEKE